MKRGFTLIEVVISLALISIVLGSVYGTFFLSSRALEASETTLLKLRELRNSFDLIGREIESSYFDPRDLSSNFLIEDRDIYGRPASRITLTTFSPQRQGLSLITYEVIEDGERLSLIKRITPFATGQPLEAEMIEDISGFRVEAKSQEKWVGTWDSTLTKSLPDEVRVIITMKTGGREFSLQEVISPKIGRRL